MKCLSLWQPWATLLVSGKKRVETRSWPLHHRGPLLIHAAKRWTPELAEISAGFFYRRALGEIGYSLTPDLNAIKTGWGLPFGAVIGRVDVLGCTPTDDCHEMLRGEPCLMADGRVGINMVERLFGDYEDGRFAFLCDRPVMLEKPIPYRGEQGLFNVPDRACVLE